MTHSIPMRSIYLAGKIAKNDWRHTVCDRLRRACTEQGFKMMSGEHAVPDWHQHNVTVLETWRYTGPYFSSDDHGCGHDSAGPGHAVTGGCILDAAEPGTWDHGTGYRNWVNRQCFEAIQRSDFVFAWVDDTTAHGTLVEIGYAKGLGKRVIVGTPMEGHWLIRDAEPLNELWFAFASADHLVYSDGPTQALRHLAEKARLANARTDSPIEASFWAAYLRSHTQLPALDGIITQHPIGRYRVDFAIPEHMIAIELDGYAYHSTRDQFTSDRARQRHLEQQGWRFIRFSGSEVKADPDKCVREAAQLAANIIRNTHPGAA